MSASGQPGEWTSKRAAKAKVSTLSAYSDLWLEGRPLKPRTVCHYRSLLHHQILPTFGDAPPSAIDSDDMRDWWVTLGGNRPTLRAHSHSLPRAVLSSVVDDKTVSGTPESDSGTRDIAIPPT